jgi:hypothetical protein
MFYETGRQVDAIVAFPTVTAHDARAADCDIREMNLCWLRRERRVRSDLGAAIATDSHDVEILVADLAAAHERVDALIDLSRRAA